jgi:hypothetical protein
MRTRTPALFAVALVLLAGLSGQAQTVARDRPEPSLPPVAIAAIGTPVDVLASGSPHWVLDTAARLSRIDPVAQRITGWSIHEGAFRLAGTPDRLWLVFPNSIARVSSTTLALEHIDPMDDVFPCDGDPTVWTWSHNTLHVVLDGELLSVSDPNGVTGERACLVDRRSASPVAWLAMFRDDHIALFRSSHAEGISTALYSWPGATLTRLGVAPSQPLPVLRDSLGTVFALEADAALVHDGPVSDARCAIRSSDPHSTDCRPIPHEIIEPHRMPRAPITEEVCMDDAFGIFVREQGAWHAISTTEEGPNVMSLGLPLSGRTLGFVQTSATRCAVATCRTRDAHEWLQILDPRSGEIVAESVVQGGCEGAVVSYAGRLAFTEAAAPGGRVHLWDGASLSVADTLPARVRAATPTYGPLGIQFVVVETEDPTCSGMAWSLLRVESGRVEVRAGPRCGAPARLVPIYSNSDERFAALSDTTYLFDWSGQTRSMGAIDRLADLRWLGYDDDGPFGVLPSESNVCRPAQGCASGAPSLSPDAPWRTRRVGQWLRMDRGDSDDTPLWLRLAPGEIAIVHADRIWASDSLLDRLLVDQEGTSLSLYDALDRGYLIWDSDVLILWRESDGAPSVVRGPSGPTPRSRHYSALGSDVQMPTPSPLSATDRTQ